MLHLTSLLPLISMFPFLLTQSLAYNAPPSSSLGEFLIQRAVQQQLYYSAQMRNEPMVDWLKRFKGHEHLDSKTRREGNCGFPGTYSATFDQLRTTPFTSYLTALGTEPDSSIKVKVIKPQRRFSARELANPYINKDPIVELYDQPIITKNILTQLCNTADALVETWAFHLGEVHKTDLERVKNDRTKNKGLPTTEMIEFAEMVKGGETAYSWFTGDEPMPLYDFDCRSLDRFNTLLSLSIFYSEVTALTPSTAFDVDYLKREPNKEEDAWGYLDEEIVRRRKKRRESFEETFVTGDDVTKGGKARDAALVFLQEFCDTWVPKLVKGDNRSRIGKESFRAKPGMKEVLPKDAGCDASAVFEALWEFQDEAAYNVLGGGELVFPRLMGERIREIRAEVAVTSRSTVLEVVAPELRQARLKFTDYVEEDDDGLGTYARFKRQAELDGDEEKEVYSHKDIIAEMGMG